MGAAYTLYKFKELFALVFIILIGWAVFSQVNPALKEAKSEAISAVTGDATSNMTKIKNPVNLAKSNVKTSIGQRIFNMFEDNPVGFFILVGIIAGLLFIGGVYLKHVRAFNRFF